MRARKCKIGTVGVSSLRKAELIIICPTISENGLKEAKKIANKLKSPLIQTKVPLEEYVYKDSVKIIALTDSNLASGVLSDSENYKKIETFLEAKIHGRK